MNKHYACADLHGMYDLWRQISDYCDDTDTIYFLGDAIDRGPRGLDIMEEMINDPRVIYLRGNHEDIMANAVAEVLDSMHLDEFYTWMSNGGEPTWNKLSKRSEVVFNWYFRKILDMKYKYVYYNKNEQVIFLCHAGTAFDYESWEEYIAEREGYKYLWDRYHIKKPWPKDKKYKDLYVVHGHTPVQVLEKEYNMPMEKDKKGNPLIMRYADGHKFDLDLGSHHSEAAALFDLDELKVAKYFYVKDDIDE